MIDFRLTDEMNPRNAAVTVGFLREPRQWIRTEEDYGARHGEWLEKVEAELVSNKRHALMAKFGRVITGAIVFRVDSSNPQTIGIRNISVRPGYEGRLLGSFMLRNVEHAAKEYYPEAKRFAVDTKATNRDMLAFLESQDYTHEEIVDLYQSGKPDVVLSKLISPLDEAA